MHYTLFILMLALFNNAKPVNDAKHSMKCVDVKYENNRYQSSTNNSIEQHRNQIDNEQQLAITVSKLADHHPEQVRRLISINPKIITMNAYQEMVKWARFTMAYDLNRSINFHLAAVEIVLRLNDEALIAHSFNDLGVVYARNYQNDNAINSFQESWKYYKLINDELGQLRTISSLASIHLYTNDYHNSALYAKAGLAFIGKIELNRETDYDYPMAIVCNVIGYLNLQDGNFPASLASYRLALGLLLRLKNKVVAVATISDVYSGISKLYFHLNEKNKAFNHIEKAQYYSALSNRQDVIANTYNNIGSFYLRQENYLKAREYYQKANNIYTLLKAAPETARLDLNIGITYQKEGNITEAIRLFTNSLQGAKILNLHDVVIASEEGLAMIYRDQGNFDMAFSVLLKAENLASRIKSPERSAEILWLRSTIHKAKADYVNAIKFASAALNFGEEFNNKELYLAAACVLGESYYRIGDLAKAKLFIIKAIDALESLRLHLYGTNFDKINYFEKNLLPYYLLTDVLISEGDFASALNSVEKIKARALVDILKDNGKDFNSNEGNDAELNEEWVISKLEESIIAIKRLIIDHVLIKKTNNLEVPKSNVIRTMPSTAEKPNVAKAFDWQTRELHDVMPPDNDRHHAFVEYFIGRESVYAFVVNNHHRSNRRKVKIYKLYGDKYELEKKVLRYNQLISNRSVSFISESRELFDILILPIVNNLIGVDTLCIVPDGFLWNAPFQAMQSSENKYLIEEYSLYYAPSAMALKEIRSGDSISSHHAFLSFANPTPPNRGELQKETTRKVKFYSSLPDAENEVKGISKLFSGRKIILSGLEANETNFYKHAPTYDVIHIATHGKLIDENPLKSFLLMSSSNDKNGDYYLEAGEVLRLKLKAGLVVLSACETAKGVVKSGEGMIGFPWAFLVAGAKSTIVTQWRVDSPTTAAFMINFYNNYLGLNSQSRLSKSQALRRSAINMMLKSRFRHPYYWAGFVIIGSNN